MLKKRKKIWTIIISLASVVLLSVLSYYAFFPKTYTKVTEENNAEEELVVRFPSRLDGTETGSEEKQLPDILGVMIDNHPNAYPQIGLKEARVVYEAPAEGGITRYLAIFSRDQIVDQVGPVRSARPYYLDWLREYGDALYMHCGGSPAALNLIKTANIFDANEFARGGYYWRSQKLQAPHNLFTDSESWQKLFDDYGSGRPVAAWEGWQFGDLAQSVSSTDAQEIKIVYGPGYEVSWKYNAEKNNYQRFMNGQAHEDGGESITADNILIQLAKVKILDEVGRREIATVGEGDGWVVRDGRVTRSRWKKTDVYDRTRFYNLEDEEIKLKSGKVWVEVAPIGTKIE